MKTVAASLRRQGLRAKASRRFRPVSYRKHGLPVSENLLKQDFYTSGPNQKWVGDITYLRTGEGWLYLAVVIDLWSRSVIGWSMSSRMTAQLACDALQMALWRRKRPENVIVHTDRGGQYCSTDYQSLLKRHNLRGKYERQRLLLRQCLCGKLLPYAEGGMYPRRGLCQPGNNADSSV
ncbi:IS3 transposase [Salmonella enterica subsp. enterica serovar Derby]|nr:IS3 transposase [Salmonella enterica subsp. enterica serovar Derby str. 626]